MNTNLDVHIVMDCKFVHIQLGCLLSQLWLLPLCSLYCCFCNIIVSLAHCIARRVPMQQCVWRLVHAHARHSVRMTYRPSAALRLLGSLRISHNKFLPANKWILILILILINVLVSMPSCGLNMFYKSLCYCTISHNHTWTNSYIMSCLVYLVWFGLCCLMTPSLSKDIQCHAWPYFF